MSKKKQKQTKTEELISLGKIHKLANKPNLTNEERDKLLRACAALLLDLVGAKSDLEALMTVYLSENLKPPIVKI